MFCDICHNEMKHLKRDLHICPKDGLITSHLKARVELYNEGYSIKHLNYAHNEIDIKLQESRRNFVFKNIPEIERGAILDFGCGNGSFLKNLDGHFGTRHGFDINPYEYFTRIDYLLRHYDAVTMWDVLEHLESPSSFIKALRTKYIFISTPSIDDVKDDVLNWRHYRPYEHIHYFNLKSLTALLSSCGYEFLNHSYDESKIRKGGGQKNIISVCGMKKEEINA